MNMFGKPPELKVAKVILLGAPDVGKSTLMIRWNTGNFESNTYSTIGSAFTSKKVIFSEDEEIQLNVWDTSGSERFDSLTKLYYRDAQVALLCYETISLESLDRTRFWAEQLRNQEPHCRLFLVATKVDLLECDGVLEEVTEQHVQNFRQESGARGYFRTSSKSGEGISELFNAVALSLLTGISPLSTRTSTISIEEDDNEKRSECFNCNID